MKPILTETQVLMAIAKELHEVNNNLTELNYILKGDARTVAAKALGLVKEDKNGKNE